MTRDIDCLNKKFLPYSGTRFELCCLFPLELSFIGKTNAVKEKAMKISFNEPFLISCPLSFTYNGGILIEEVVGQSLWDMNQKYQITIGNRVFRIKANGTSEFHFIIAKDVSVTIN